MVRAVRRQKVDMGDIRELFSRIESLSIEELTAFQKDMKISQTWCMDREEGRLHYTIRIITVNLIKRKLNVVGASLNI